MNTYSYDANCRFDVEAESEEVARTLLETKLGNIGAGYVETYLVNSKEDEEINVAVYLDTIVGTAFNTKGDWRFKEQDGNDAFNFGNIKLKKKDFKDFYYEKLASEWKTSFEEFLNDYSCEDTDELLEWLKENNKEYKTIIDKDIAILPYHTSFIDDKEKMRDFFLLTKKEFLESYSYLCEEEYDQTKEEVALKWTELMCG